MLDLALCLELSPMLVADVRSLQALAQALLDGSSLLASNTTSLPSQIPPTRSVRRHRRRQVILRKSYKASLVDSCAQANEGASAPVSLAHGSVFLCDRTPTPIPTGSTSQPNHVEALTDDEVPTILRDLPSVRLSTYDFN